MYIYIGKVIYHTGDTDIFGDMKIISELFKPDIALMCIGGHFTMGPVYIYIYACL